MFLHREKQISIQPFPALYAGFPGECARKPALPAAAAKQVQPAPVAESLSQVVMLWDSLPYRWYGARHMPKQ
ncbi:hypothetical protein SAMN05880570_0540 [Paenibacillus sp. RU4T]|nr:hypothetical protein SAMN05880555_0541 [Paenibacillus sp. RU4X]SIQ27381.1 hypothetical protein SAMN05880570_0540 [Paenibacillus sp. RU4T]